MRDHEIHVEEFTETDFDRLIGWVSDIKELVLFSGPVFRFPLTREQLQEHAAPVNRHLFKAVHTATGNTIGHGEVLVKPDNTCRLCNILIGDKTFRGKGYGKQLTLLLTAWSFANPDVQAVDLNVYDFNTAAIKNYESCGFRFAGTNEISTPVNGEHWVSCRMVISRESFVASESPAQ
jgi:RimJ/RimL family protein N-acetyltransferase